MNPIYAEQIPIYEKISDVKENCRYVNGLFLHNLTPCQQLYKKFYLALAFMTYFTQYHHFDIIYISAKLFKMSSKTFASQITLNMNIEILDSHIERPLVLTLVTSCGAKVTTVCK